MEFLELNREEYSAFARSHPLKSFFQTVEMESLSEHSGWKSYYVGVKENNKIVAATRMVSYKNRLGYSYFYAPRGLLLEYQNKVLLSFFTNNLKKYIKKRKGYVLRIDPSIVHVERDSEGNIVRGGENNEWCVEALKKCGYIHKGYRNGYDETSQCRWVYCLDLEGKTEEDLLKDMKPTTRNQIKKTLKYGIRIRKLKYEELPIFKAITKEASERNHFHDKNLSYYEQMYQIFEPTHEIQYIVAELEPKVYLKNLEKELEEWTSSFEKLSSHPKNDGKRKELQISINSTKKRIEQMKALTKKECIPIAGAMFILYGDEIIYYHSGNYKEYIGFNGQLMIQWYMLKYGLKHHFKRYNFFGISGIFDTNSKEQGVYEFKKGFGGYVEEYIGDFDLPICWYYYIQKLLHRS